MQFARKFELTGNGRRHLRGSCLFKLWPHGTVQNWPWGVLYVPADFSLQNQGDPEQEWLGLKVGYTSREICHHCAATSSAFMVVPSVLEKLPGRDIENVVSSCLRPGIRSPWDFVHG